MTDPLIYPSEDFLHRMYERSPVGFYRSTFDGRFVFVNPALVRMLRHQRAEDVLQLQLARDVYFDPSDRARLILRYRETGTIDGLKVRWRTRDGQPLVVQLYGYLLPEINCIDATVIDVTELDAAHTRIEHQREELERSATTLRLLWKQLPGLVWTVDRELRITSADGAAIATFGRTVEDNIGKTLYRFYGTERSSYLPIRRHLEALEGRWVGFNQAVNGKQFAVTLAPHRSENGTIVGVIGVGIDVTTRHQLEERMVDAQRAESLGVLAGGLAHDFNNLLVAILGNADLGLREIQVGAPGREVLENVRAAALGAAALTTQLLAYAGRGQILTSDIVLAPIVDELLRLAAPQIPPNVHVEVDVSLELPPIRGDAAQLRQVVMNLITNARDAVAERGGIIVVSATVVEFDGTSVEHDVLVPPTAGRFVALEVADDGSGMEARTLRRIFDPFFSTKPNGHGLGLASVLGIVRSHGGGISVVTESGKGATFRVLWPVRSARGGRSPTEPSGAPLPIGAVSHAARTYTIMVVDDEDPVRDVLVRLIEDLGYAVIAAADGGQALAVVDGATEIDAMVLDPSMPGMSGGVLIQEVRHRRPRVPIIVCSGYDRDRKGMPAAEGFLSKPFRIEALQGLLVSLVGAPSERPDQGADGPNDSNDDAGPPA
jgi:two-component system, cell cycle sensor histidine kinase and response regulator CckA